MMLVVGWRVVRVIVPNPDDPAVLAFLRELRAFGEFHGIEPNFYDPGEGDPPGTIEFEFSANGSVLNDYTPYFANGARQIAADIDAHDLVLRSIADAITDQLHEQL